MAKCPNCHAGLPLGSLLASRGLGRNFSRESNRYRLSCPQCRSALEYRPGALRLFTFVWLAPLAPLAWVVSLVLPGSTVALLLATAIWMIGFPLWWIPRVDPTLRITRDGR